jgi:hypothetical protein
VAGYSSVETLKPGDVLTRDHDGKSYDVEILDKARTVKDLFGRDMLGFRTRILPGRDAGGRVGDEGDLIFGKGGVVRSPRTKKEWEKDR